MSSICKKCLRPMPEDREVWDYWCDYCQPESRDFQGNIVLC